MKLLSDRTDARSAPLPINCTNDIPVARSLFFTDVFLQRISIACYAERCTSYSKSVRLFVCPSVRLSHASTVSTLLMLRSQGLHCRIAPWLSFPHG